MKHQSPNPVHPRLRGELMTPVEFWSQVIGSSPLTRGTPRQPAVDSAPCRFIPAYAGNSSDNGAESCWRSVHPRLRGELDSLKTRECPSLRFIPAYAGNSPWRGRMSAAMPVHPRLRGELNSDHVLVMSWFGSSPLTRGTHLNKA